MTTDNVLKEVAEERQLQDIRFDEQNHPIVSPTYGQSSRDFYHNEALLWKLTNDQRFKSGDLAWDGILLEEVYEALAESDPKKIRAELIQVAAVAVAAIECLDRAAASAQA